MAFAVFLVYLAVTFLRPGEQFPQLQEWAVMDVVSGLALATTAVAVISGRAPGYRTNQVLLVLFLWLWSVFTVVVSPLRSETALGIVMSFGKSSCIAFLLVVLNVVSLRRLRIVAVLLSVLALLIGLQATIGYQSGFGAGPMITGPDSRPSSPDLQEAAPMEPAEAPSRIERIRGVGIFGDPNDLAVTLLAVLPLSLGLRKPRSPVYNLMLVWIPVLAITYSIYLTRSRSGFVAFAAVLVLLLRRRVGTLWGLVGGGAALMGLLAIGFLGGRAFEMDRSAMGRIYAWSDGLQMLKSSPLWGVGFGMFSEYHPRVAHNSFVHCVAELGLIGYLCWLALILLTLDDLRFVEGESEGGRAGPRAWASAVTTSIAASLAGGLFLSRAYDLSLFIQLGLGTALVDMARREGRLPRTRTLVLSLTATLGVAVLSIVAVWLYMRLN